MIGKIYSSSLQIELEELQQIGERYTISRMHCPVLKLNFHGASQQTGLENNPQIYDLLLEEDSD